MSLSENLFVLFFADWSFTILAVSTVAAILLLYVILQRFAEVVSGLRQTTIREIIFYTALIALFVTLVQIIRRLAFS